MTSVKPLRSALIMICSALVLACASNSVGSDPDSAGVTPGNTTGTVPAAGTQDGDWAAIEKLEGEAKAIAKATGCAAASACRSAPVGSRACGGPRYFIPYCSATTDSAALFRVLDRVAEAERAYNAKYQLASTCELRMPLEVTLSGGVCTSP